MKPQPAPRELPFVTILVIGSMILWALAFDPDLQEMRDQVEPTKVASTQP